MKELRTILAAVSIVAAGSPAFAAKPIYVASNWNDLVSKVNCKDTMQSSDGQWQLIGDVSIGGSINSNPVVPAANVDALKKKCSTCGTHTPTSTGVGC